MGPLDVIATHSTSEPCPCDVVGYRFESKLLLSEIMYVIDEWVGAYSITIPL